MTDKIMLDPDVTIDPDELDTSEARPEFHEVTPEEVAQLDIKDAKMGGDDE